MTHAKKPAGKAEWTPLLVTGAVLVLACSPSKEQAWNGNMGEAADETEARVATVPSGTTLTFLVDETVSTGTKQASDAFTASVASDVYASDGSIAIPAGSPSRWVVTRSETSTSGEREATLAFRLESVEMDGDWVPVVATVTGAELKTGARDPVSRTAGKVAVGAAAGAIGGDPPGGDKSSAAGGAGVRAAANAMVAITTRDGSAELPSGSTLTVRLNEAAAPR